MVAANRVPLLEPPASGELLDETQLISRARDRDADAERQLYEAHVDRVFRLAYRMTGDDSLAQDLTQDTFIRAFDRLSSFRGDASFSTWLHSITTSVVLNAMRKVKKIRQRETELDEAVETGPVTHPPDALLKLRLQRAIDRLSEPLRVVFVMHEMEGFQHGEISEILAIAEGSSKARLSRAKTQLREHLAAVAPRFARGEGL